MASSSTTSDQEWRIGDYSIVKELGEGAYSNVYQAVYDKIDETCSTKISKAEDFDKSICEEADILANLQFVAPKKKHPYIIGLYQDSVIEETYIHKGKESQKKCLVYNLCSRGTVFDFIFLVGAFEEKLFRTYFQHFVNAMEHVHAQGYIHRDLKAENLLLDDKYCLQVSDFGLAGKCDEKGFIKDKRICGTKGYMAPEIFGGDYGTQVDIFAMGVILFCFACARPPFTQTGEGNCIWWKQVKERNYDKFWTWQNQGGDLDNLSDEFKEFVMKFFIVAPQERITFEKMKADKWWNGETYSDEELLKVMKDLESSAENEDNFQVNGCSLTMVDEKSRGSVPTALPSFNILAGKEGVKKEYDRIDIYEETDETETDSKDELLVYNSHVINRTKFLTKEAPHLIMRGLEAICGKDNIACKRESNYQLECIHEGLDEGSGGEKEYKFLIQVHKSAKYEGYNWVVFTRRCDSLLQFMQLYAVFHCQLRNYIVTTTTVKNQKKSTTTTTKSCISTTVES